MPISQKYLPVFILVSSLVLYVAGVATGWFIGQQYYKNAENKLSKLESQMKELWNIPSSPDLCSYTEARYYMLLSSLGYFNLPYRLESANVPVGTLEQYTSVEVQAFLTGQVLKAKCGIEPRLIVYFFERGKPESVKAGEMLDKAKDGFVVLAFPVDLNSSSVQTLLGHLNVTRFPAINVCGETIAWPFTEEEIVEAEKKCG